MDIRNLMPHPGDSNEYPQHMFLWRNDENYYSIIIKYPLYLFHCLMTVCLRPFRIVLVDDNQLKPTHTHLHAMNWEPWPCIQSPMTYMTFKMLCFLVFQQYLFIKKFPVAVPKSWLRIKHIKITRPTVLSGYTMETGMSKSWWKLLHVRML